MSQNEEPKPSETITSPRSMTPPTRSKSPVKSLFSLKFSPKRSLSDNSPKSPTTNSNEQHSKSNPNSPHNSSNSPDSPHNNSGLNSPHSPHSPHAPNVPRVPNVPYLRHTMSASPIRNMGINTSAPETPNTTPRPPILLKSISSPRQRRSSFSTFGSFGIFMRSSPPKKTSNLLNSTDEINNPNPELIESPPLSPISPRYLCHQCRKYLEVNKEKEIFLAIKCGCEGPPCYFCTRECYRAHWISKNSRGQACEFNKFEEYLHKMSNMSPEIKFPLACTLEWDEEDNIHQISEYNPMSYLDQ